MLSENLNARAINKYTNVLGENNHAVAIPIWLKPIYTDLLTQR